jgi:hypothetical protein
MVLGYADSKQVMVHNQLHGVESVAQLLKNFPAFYGI